MHQFFKSTWLNFEVVRILGTAPNGGADICEVLEAVEQIEEGNAESWHDAWKTQAERAHATARRCLAAGNRELARRAFLRAANYTRASGYLLLHDADDHNPRALAIAEAAVALFRRGITLSDHPVEFLEIPYPGGVHLPGYLYLPPHDPQQKDHKVPVLIACNGADSTQEELYFLHPAAAPGQGYACLTFDGPGQGLTLRRHRLTLRPDWEYVMGHVVRFLHAWVSAHPRMQPGLDLDRIAITGSALGGYFALRAAAHDPHRTFKACVALDPVYDLWDFATHHVSPAFIRAWQHGWIPADAVDAIINVAARCSFQMRWEVALAKDFFRLARPSEVLLEMRKFSLKGDEHEHGLGHGPSADGGCPTLVSGAGDSLYLPVDDHTMKIWTALQHLPETARELWLAEKPADGALQAKIGAFALSNEYAFRFLDEQLGVVRERITG
ncbi:alpha/beta-hydrolase [Aspergillus heteromorphus CBS 117.55]|uniref:Alpha/beta-hydrolase n=1 Tax=Aspergillus heteromorphus CBS 117.55 TaxID=1448321 RepID=A0A317W9A4_9EURO|nr:alpha/beta-hydrolase [Aspergillus heteromorphus CBS 117.55]PWY81897.1 alpha/beta-hydrolase [Aspergillus heteromorphus CBS 117.55]